MVDKVTESCKTVDKYTVAILTEETKVLVGHSLYQMKQTVYN